MAGKTVEEATDRALDQLGVALADAEVIVVSEPKTGLFGRMRVEATGAGPGAPRRRPAAPGALPAHHAPVGTGISAGQGSARRSAALGQRLEPAARQRRRVPTAQDGAAVRSVRRPARSERRNGGTDERSPASTGTGTSRSARRRATAAARRPARRVRSRRGDRERRRLGWANARVRTTAPWGAEQLRGLRSGARNRRRQQTWPRE